MSQENLVPVIKFAEEGKGRDISYLSDSASPVYYGFNCTPRQVRYYKVEKSVEEILKGGFTRKDVEQFTAKVKEKMCKAENKYAEYEAKVLELRKKRSECQDFETRQILRKEENKVETRMYNYEYDTLGKYQKAYEALTKFLA
jgi:hypothetical protein